jgi:hypothetical protein
MLLPFLAGVLFKVYDDFVDDEPYLTSPHVTTTLQLLQVALFTLVAQSSFVFTLVFTAFNACAALASWGEYSEPHVWAYFWICPILLVASFASRTALARFDYPIFYGYLAYGLVEPRLYREETSVFKMLSRGIAGWVSLLSQVLFQDELSAGMRTLMVLSGGYGVASSMGQMLKLFVLQTPSM